MCLVRIVSDKVKFVIMMNWEETCEKKMIHSHTKRTQIQKVIFSGLALCIEQLHAWMN